MALLIQLFMVVMIIEMKKIYVEKIYYKTGKSNIAGIVA